MSKKLENNNDYYYNDTVPYSLYIRYILLGALYNKPDSPLKYQIVEFFEKIQNIFKITKIICDDDIEYLFYKYFEIEHEIDTFEPYLITFYKYKLFHAILLPYLNNIMYDDDKK